MIGRALLVRTGSRSDRLLPSFRAVPLDATRSLLLPVQISRSTTEDTEDTENRCEHREKLIDAFALLFYYRGNTGKEVIQNMSSYHSEVAAA